MAGDNRLGQPMAEELVRTTSTDAMAHVVLSRIKQEVEELPCYQYLGASELRLNYRW